VVRQAERRRLAASLIVSVSMALPIVSVAYGVNTHLSITNAAVVASSLNSNSSLWSELSLPLGPALPSPAASTAIAAQIAAFAAQDEDGGIRSLFHFLDPQQNGAALSSSGFSVTCPLQLLAQNPSFATAYLFSTINCFPLYSSFTVAANSDQWAAQGAVQGDLLLAQTTFSLSVADGYFAAGNTLLGFDWDYDQAKNEFYQAITGQTAAARSTSTGLMFQNLGHVLHHLQDMAQPQHVRNDAHCDSGWCALVNFRLYARSAYEDYVEGLTAQNALPGVSSPLPTPPFTFTTPDQFWTTGALQGLADFTSTNFVSIGTNFGINLLAQPVTDGVHRAPAAPVPGNLTPLIPAPCNGGAILLPPNFSPRGYVSRTIVDNAGFFYNVPNQTVKESLQSYPFLYSSFTLDCHTYDDAVRILIPQAITYSAWFTNFMFRGSITPTFSSTDGTVMIANGSPSEAWTGVDVEVYADVSGTRTLIGSCSIGSIGVGQNASCLPQIPALPVASTYLVVLSGQLGQEQNQIGFARVAAPTVTPASLYYWRAYVANPMPAGPYTWCPGNNVLYCDMMMPMPHVGNFGWVIDYSVAGAPDRDVVIAATYNDYTYIDAVYPNLFTASDPSFTWTGTDPNTPMGLDGTQSFTFVVDPSQTSVGVYGGVLYGVMGGTWTAYAAMEPIWCWLGTSPLFCGAPASQSGVWSATLTQGAKPKPIMNGYGACVNECSGRENSPSIGGCNWGIKAYINVINNPYDPENYTGNARLPLGNAVPNACAYDSLVP
jgi:hypothetical protein